MSLMARFGTTTIGVKGSIGTASAHQIRDQLAAFLANEQSLRSLIEWLTRNIWNSGTEEPDAIRLAGDVELIVAEYSEQHIDREELRRQLEGLLQKQRTTTAAATSTRQSHR
jgi:hypothetical protein